ncbi:carboxypeptidase-like regulatory domain-containing protein [bacterium]|nr:carboxypeptidase-like regulatory domain-containing protein [bacterium]
MKKQIITLFLLMLIMPANATTFIGEVTKVGQQDSNRIIDSQTKQGVEFAKITIPQKNIQTYSDGNGNFELPPIVVKSPLIMNIEKEGYRPFSITINNNASLNSPMKIEIAKSEALDIAIDTEILHLGDNSFSKNSANASDFRLKSMGPSYSKDFIMTQSAKRATNYLIIGSIVGLDTQLAKSMGQNKIKTSAFSSPTEVYFNGNKIGEIKINGDGQRIKIPGSLIKADAKNQITIKTGENMGPTNHIDYDDIEIMNLSILTE